MVRIITLNLNGIRSAWRKGVLPWVSGQNADLVCVQELKAQAADLDEEMKNPDGLHAYYRHAERKGYSGVGLWCRKQPERVFDLLGNDEFDGEGRYLRADFGGLSIVSLYQPSGSSSEQRQLAKFRFMALIYAHLVELAASGRDVIVCGDWNIAHQEIDLRNWRSNRRNSGFLPAERAWVSRLLNEAGWSDVYRKLHPAATDEAYTWWSNRGQAWAKNVGWRLDYQLATAAVASKARRATVYKEQRFSDHAPLSIDYDYHLQTGPTGCTPL
ncbi:MAG: exodeoxyribonuclease III [Candidatus Accumulibacter sp.]|uniref:Exodeoxyribonuclease III n=1 Tax=Candidatus Accumulibacter affinis TaxID=2954384 RepID=A0A935T4H1_9PROT|nr:exodeoxyribonuclease III [Candidatus Accumulibacter affinis]MBP9804476.1 exodeoxyribonuclease III [Accumulibacter sp.]